MKKTIICIVGFVLILAAAGHAGELSGIIGVEGAFFLQDPLYKKQKNNDVSVFFQPEYYHEWNNSSQFICIPFVRHDAVDPERSHVDMRELNFRMIGDTWEIQLGIGKVFWGVTEFVHLVDIINQTDLVENIDEEDLLGQPMVHLSLPRNFGVVDVFVLPYFRERTFPGEHGRLRTSIVVDTDNAQYESNKKKRHIDYAVRYAHTIGGWDMGVYHFNGTSRDPLLRVSLHKKNKAVLIPYYEQINQTGMDIQCVAGSWLFKAESFFQQHTGKDFFAATGGFEYSFIHIAGSSLDVGVIGEWVYDDRGARTPGPYDNDAMGGLRFGFNDFASSELLAGIIQDIDNSSRIISVEASRRIGVNWKAVLETRIFLDAHRNDSTYSFRDDDFLKFELIYHF